MHRSLNCLFDDCKWEDTSIVCVKQECLPSNHHNPNLLKQYVHKVPFLYHSVTYFWIFSLLSNSSPIHRKARPISWTCSNGGPVKLTSDVHVLIEFYRNVAILHSNVVV